MGFDNNKNEWVGYIYLITNKINNKKYVGQTRKKAIYRFNEHTSKYNRSNTVIDLAIKKYGKENFNFKVIETVFCNTKNELIDKLNELEIKYIEEFNTFKGDGYNCTIGGNSRSHLGISVDKYSVDGLFVSNYDTISDAIDSVGIKSVTSVLLVCKGERNTAGGYVWRFKGDPFEKYSIEDKKNRKVDSYTKDGVYLKTYNTIVDAAKEYDVIPSTIMACCIGKIHLIKDNYVFRYHNEDFNKFKIFVSDKKPVDVYNYKKEKIRTFDSIKSAADYYGTTPITISEACRGISMTIKGNVFRYKDEPFDKYKVKFRGCVQYDKEGNFIAEYKNQSEASRVTGLSLHSIQKCCSGKQKYVSDFIFATVG